MFKKDLLVNIAVVVIVLVAGGALFWFSARELSQKAYIKGQMSVPDCTLPTAIAAPVTSAAPLVVKKHTVLPVSSADGIKTYTSEAGCLSVVPRDPTFRPTLYPFHVEVKTYATGAIRSCGMFPTVQGDGWRVAYCPTDKGSQAVRTYLYKEDNAVSLELGEDLYGPFQEGVCK